MISCRADLFNQIRKLYHPAEIRFGLDISIHPYFFVDKVKFSNTADQNDETLDGCLEWLSEIVDELFIPINEKLKPLNQPITRDTAREYVEFMQERLSQLPRVIVEPKIVDALIPSSEPDRNGAFRMMGTYTIYVKVEENK